MASDMLGIFSRPLPKVFALPGHAYAMSMVLRKALTGKNESRTHGIILNNNKINCVSLSQATVFSGAASTEETARRATLEPRLGKRKVALFIGYEARKIMPYRIEQNICMGYNVTTKNYLIYTVFAKFLLVHYWSRERHTAVSKSSPILRRRRL